MASKRPREQGIHRPRRGRHRPLLLVLFALLGLTALAAPAQAERPVLITEKYFHPQSASSVFSDIYERFGRPYRYNREAWAGSLWSRIVAGLGIAPADDGRSSECRYDTAVRVLQEIRAELGENSAYEPIWLRNQDRVFSACDARHRNSVLAPSPPVGADLPQRAMADFAYQMASWHFYQGHYDEALRRYEALAAQPNAAARPLASYMVIRSLRAMGSGDEAYRRIDPMLADKSLVAVHSLLRNYRFILMYPAWYRSKAIDNAETATRHLLWMLDLVHRPPAAATDIERAYREHYDAMLQIATYFPRYAGGRYGEDKRVDWWLGDGRPESKRMQAVKMLAPDHEFVDWMQAYWAYNVFETDWLWALHEADHPYWKQNARIVDHAWRRWQAGDGLHWLRIAITRMRPDDPRAGDAIAAVLPFVPTDEEWSRETDEFRRWSEDVLHHAIRLDIGRGNLDAALELLQRHPQQALYNPVASREEPNARRMRADLQIVNWLVYSGRIDQARAVLGMIEMSDDPFMYRAYRDASRLHDRKALLASDWSAFLNGIRPSGRGYPQDEVYGDPDTLWKHLLNLVSHEQLHDLASDPRLPRDMQVFLANAALARAMLLGEDDRIEAYAARVGALTPAWAEDVIAAVADHDRDDYVGLMLRMPRLRPVPYTPLANTAGSREDIAQSSAIDDYNPNDNNWWCRFSAERLERRLFEFAHVEPQEDEILGRAPEAERQPYFENQRRLLATHPFRTRIDKAELEALEEIPAAPQYLSEAVIERIERPWWKFWLDHGTAEQNAADLHYAVRTTRYGCRGGVYDIEPLDHGAYSRRAFELLHQRYGDTAWAAATPYWFDTIR